MTTDQKIAALRQQMAAHRVDAVIIPSNDPHQSEYVAKRWEARQWISGFTGSAGTVVVTADHAGLWTDSRYYLQGETELAGSSMTLHKYGQKGVAAYADWIRTQLHQGQVVHIAGSVCSIAMLEQLEKKYSPKGIQLNTKLDLVADIWADRPTIPTDPIYLHDSAYAGKTRLAKLADVRRAMAAREVDHHLVATLDDIAWLYNIRGSDVDFNPVAVAYALVSTDATTLYINTEKVPDDVVAALSADGVHCKPYEALVQDLNTLPTGDRILIDPDICNVVLYQAINCKKIRGATLSTKMKSIKNATEIAHTKKVMVRDGVALAHTFYWLDQLHKNGETCTEAEFADRLASNRSQQEGYKGESFPAIIGYKGNGAIVHYRPMHGSSAEIGPEGILLCDSGGQYIDGTTDITRTITLGTPTATQKRDFTLVLKGHIQLARATFPEGTTGGQLDILARMHLWDHGLNYGHGTGHGVGFFLNVHEGPHGIAPPASSRSKVPIEVGTYTSNEPGYYKEGEYGIRVENLVFAVEAKEAGYIEFDTVTLYPIDLKLIDENRMTKGEKAWLNKYHSRVWQEVSPHLEGDIKTWFELKCRGMN